MIKFQLTPLQAPPGGPNRSKVRHSSTSGHEKRRGVRVNSRVPVAVEWDSAGELCRGETKTRVIGPYGCMLVLQQDLQIDQHISVINLVSRQTSPAVIVWRGHESADGRELGIELINPDMGFWGVDL